MKHTKCYSHQLWVYFESHVCFSQEIAASDLGKMQQVLLLAKASLFLFYARMEIELGLSYVQSPNMILQLFTQ